MPARLANTRDSSEGLGEVALCRSMLADMAGRHDLGTLLQGNSLEGVAGEEEKCADYCGQYVPIQDTLLTDFVAIRDPE